MAKNFDDILNECLDRVLIEGEDIEQCLADYPELAEELKPMLQTALKTKSKFASIQPRPEFKSIAKQRFLSQARINREQQKQPKPRRFSFFEWQRRWTIAVAAVLFVVLIGGSSAVAA
ncbi:MAG: hypothetical protein SVM79_09920, partial [Chloroflexota bacterium]|nr:hypothetical protein [Chloroflexota bacterium]